MGIRNKKFDWEYHVGKAKVSEFNWPLPNVEFFPHQIKIPTPASADRLRLIRWLNSHDQELHRDFEVENDFEHRYFYFKDPDIAMIFKLSWAI